MPLKWLSEKNRFSPLCYSNVKWFRWLTGDFEAWLGVAAHHAESVTQSSKPKLWAPNGRIHDVIEELLWPCPVLRRCTWLLTPFMNWSQRWRRAQIYAHSSIGKVAKKWEFSDNHFQRCEIFMNRTAIVTPSPTLWKKTAKNWGRENKKYASAIRQNFFMHFYH